MTPKSPKTFGQFETFRKQLFAEPFDSKSMNAISLGVARSTFEAEQMRKLLQAAESVEVISVRKKIPAWKNKLLKIEGNLQRFKQINQETAQPLIWPTPPAPKKHWRNWKRSSIR